MIHVDIACPQWPAFALDGAIISRRGSVAPGKKRLAAGQGC
jgi:hypothetical protein